MLEQSIEPDVSFFELGAKFFARIVANLREPNAEELDKEGWHNL
jgi:hypothetical protein